MSSFLDEKRAERRHAMLAWAPLALTAAIWLPLAWLNLICLPTGEDVWVVLGWLNFLFSGIAFTALCGLIITHQPQNRIGWLCGVIGVVPALIAASFTIPQCADQGRITFPGVSYVAWCSSFFGLAISLQFLLLPLWFPDGRFQSAGWRRFGLIAYAFLLLGAILAAFWPGELIFAEAIGIPTGAANPFGLPFEPSPEQTRLAQAFLSISLVGGMLVANFSLFFRWRNADRQTRQQIKVFAFFLVTVGTTYFLFELVAQLLLPAFNLFDILGGWLYMALLALVWVGYPIAIGVAVLKYRMYDVDVVIRKTVTYALVTSILGFIFLGSIITLQQVFSMLTRSGQNEIVTVISTLVIAALFVPLRYRIQRVIDKRFYRKKYDAQKVLQDFAVTVRDETDLEKLAGALMKAVQETMEPRSLEIWLRADRKEEKQRRSFDA